MQRIEWSKELEIGINVIDAQHRRIVAYINTLADLEGDVNTEEIASLIDSLVDYTYSHFAFEESLMEEAEYEFITVHKDTHKAFSERIKALHTQFKNGEHVTRELGQILQTWLIEHIKSDDQSYAPVVLQKFAMIERKSNGNWIPDSVSRFFNRPGN